VIGHDSRHLICDILGTVLFQSPGTDGDEWYSYSLHNTAGSQSPVFLCKRTSTEEQRAESGIRWSYLGPQCCKC